ncbi:hypothetical protein [Oculatella sp. LEGE 06141]
MTNPASLKESVPGRTEIAAREQPRRTASLIQLDDPCVYYYLAWASPP